MRNSLTDGLVMAVHRIDHHNHISVHYISVCGSCEKCIWTQGGPNRWTTSANFWCCKTH